MQTCRPLAPILGDFPPDVPLKELVAKAIPAFLDYPERSFISATSRALLFSLIRKHRFHNVAEIGTFFGGTTEVLARALWENRSGNLFTVDPYNEGRFAKTLETWPQWMRQHTEFHPLYSMAFFGLLALRKVALDFVLVDGNHDFEYALFDLQMAARMMRPGGIIAMDNCDQTGPFSAAQTFIARNPGWRELGNALGAYNPSDPFGGIRSSYPETTLILLQSPRSIMVDEAPRSWGQQDTRLTTVRALSLGLPTQSALGSLSYRCHLRLFADGARGSLEKRCVGSLLIDGAHPKASHPIEPLTCEPLPGVPFRNLIEVELSWRGNQPLVLSEPPTLT